MFVAVQAFCADMQKEMDGVFGLLEAMDGGAGEGKVHAFPPLPEGGRLPEIDRSYRLDENGYLTYQGGRYAKGVDVSAHQKEIDWSRVAASGMSFAMIRAGYRGYTLGAITKDEYFDANMSGALANGMDVGVYFFSQALTPAEAEEEARQVLEWIKDYKVTYPIVFDWEEQDKDNSRTRNTDGNTVTACALAFCKVIKEAGYTPRFTRGGWPWSISRTTPPSGWPTTPRRPSPPASATAMISGSTPAPARWTASRAMWT
jgi:hypothetical protein